MYSFALALLLDSMLLAPVPAQPEAHYAFDNPVYFSEAYFGAVLKRHDAARPFLERQRHFIATHAPELSRLVTTLPGTGHLTEATVRRTLTAPHGIYTLHPGAAVFRPWTGRWAGRWSDGSKQRHVWDPAWHWQGRWVQLVTQSERVFATSTRLPRMKRKREVDLAVNVYDPTQGITGWVSKRQHGAQELPCIGYLLNAHTLLWIVMLAPDKQKREWMLFVERSDTRTYRIEGRHVLRDSSGAWTVMDEQHEGIYHAAPIIPVASFITPLEPSPPISLPVSAPRAAQNIRRALGSDDDV